jgi:DNA-binding LacI/PurR family transcriptional regulator
VEGVLARFRLDRDGAVGLTGQIRSHIALLIADNELATGDQLPPVRDLARHLGVTVNTVRAAYEQLASDGLVVTRHGVGTTVLQGGAVSLAHRAALGHNTIGVVVAGLNPFYLPVLRGIETIAAERGNLVVVADAHDSPDEAAAIVRRLAARGMDGLITLSVGGPPEGWRDQPGQRRFPPVVMVDQPDQRGHVLVFDGRAAGELATRHLLEHGHRRIGFVTAPIGWPNVADVHAGYCQALLEAGADTDPALVAEVEGFSVAAGRRALALLLQLADPPTAVVAGGEPLTVGVLQEARAQGRRVPEDLAIVGYNDSPVATLVDPPLTMVSVPTREIGMRAMRLLGDLIDGRRVARRRIVLEPSLQVRRSCGC